MMNIVFATGARLLGIYESEHTPMMLGMTLWIMILVLLVWALVTWLNKKASGAVPPASHLPPPGPSALEILQQHYARGEIDTATFEQMRELFGASSRSEYQNQPMADVR